MDNIVELGAFSAFALLIFGIIKDMAQLVMWSMIIMIALTAIGIIFALVGLFTGDEDVSKASVIMFLISVALIIVALAVCIPALPNKEIFGLTVPNAIAATSVALIIAHLAEKILGIPLGIVGFFMSDD